MTIIANPIYDVVFKRLMENEKIAKFFISTLLNETIEHVECKPQEYTHLNKIDILSLFRLDFIATIKTEEGEYKKVLIEIQKAKDEIDLARFRNYLGEQYKKEDTVNDLQTGLPITTIYILGFTLRNISTSCLKISRTYQDLINNVEIKEKNDFVEKLTHDCFIVQINRITNRYQTRLDKLLSIFEQTHFIDEHKITKEFTHVLDIEEIKLATEILHHACTDPNERKIIEAEREAWRTFDAMYGKKLKKIQDKLDKEKKKVEERDKELEEKDKALEEKENLIQQLMQELKKQ